MTMITADSMSRKNRNHLADALNGIQFQKRKLVKQYPDNISSHNTHGSVTDTAYICDTFILGASSLSSSAAMLSVAEDMTLCVS